MTPVDKRIPDPIGEIRNGKLVWNTDGGPEAWRKRKDYSGQIYTYADMAATCAQSEQNPVPTWVVVQRQGFSAVRKGPLIDFKHTEQMLRELYELHPDCICTVIAFDHAEWPEDGREWLSIHGDGRRKKPMPAPNYKAQIDALLARLDVISEVHIISETYDRIRAERIFAADDLEYDLFAAGWKAAIASVKNSTCKHCNGKGISQISDPCICQYGVKGTKP